VRCIRNFSWLLAFTLIVISGANSQVRADGVTTSSLWNVAGLMGRAPAVRYGASAGLTQEVWYEGEPLAGKPTWIFAYLGRPKDVPAGERAPAILLVHGGGGRAFKDWAEHWAARGYVALAMDTAGQGADGKRHGEAGPDQSDQTKFRNFSDSEAREVWSYHAVAAVLRGHGLLNSLPEVDTERIGITGISWGGYLTCMVAGIDHALKVAVPVYGCGFLGENSVWRDQSLAAMNAGSRARWLKLFDPSRVVGNVHCPILFLNGMHDFAYPPDSYRKTYMLVPEALRTLSVRVDLPHGHFWNLPEVDAFVDYVLKPDPRHEPLARMRALSTDGTSSSAQLLEGGPLTKAELHYTTATENWTTATWVTTPATIGNGEASAEVPPERPLALFFTVTDKRGLITSTAYVDLPKQ
jgi:dienelactone hydrolase